MAVPVNKTPLVGAKRDAALAITALFKTYGLESLAPYITQYLQQGYAPDTVSILLQQTPAYKTRFAGNTARIKAGLSVLSPGEYLATERAYRDTLAKHGLPVGFYDKPSDFQSFIEKDISPTELDQRATAASDFIQKNDKQTLDYFKKYYTTGDMVAFALDSKRAAPLVGKAFQASNIGGAATASGVNIDRARAEELAAGGITTQQAQQGFGEVGQDLRAAKQLSQIYGGQALTQDDLINSLFENNADASERKKKLASKERASFNGASGLSRGALTSDPSGTE